MTPDDTHAAQVDTGGREGEGIEEADDVAQDQVVSDRLRNGIEPGHDGQETIGCSIELNNCHVVPKAELPNPIY